MKKKLITLVLCSMFAALTVTGCGGQKAGADGGSAKGLNIAIVSSPSGVDDGSFNQDNYNGILSFIEEHPESKVTPVKEPTGDTAACIKTVNDIVADYDVIVCDGFQFAGIGEVAQ